MSVAGLLVSLGVLTTLVAALDDPGRVDLVVDNATDHQVSVVVRPADGARAQNLGPVGPRSSKRLTSVVDQGSTWVFEYSSAGVAAGEVEVARTRLRDGEVVVPESVGDALEQAGLRPRS
jgi:hypothetical protein